MRAPFNILTLNPLTWKIWWAPNNASRWQVGFNSAFKGLTLNLCLMETYKQKQPYWGPNWLRSVYLLCDLPKFRWAGLMARIEERICTGLWEEDRMKDLGTGQGIKMGFKRRMDYVNWVYLAQKSDQGFCEDGGKPLVSVLQKRRLSIRHSFRNSCWVQGHDKTDTGIFSPTTIYLPIYTTYMGRIFLCLCLCIQFCERWNSVVRVSPL